MVIYSNSRRSSLSAYHYHPWMFLPLTAKLTLVG